jgi:hypothetical protein
MAPTTLVIVVVLLVASAVKAPDLPLPVRLDLEGKTTSQFTFVLVFYLIKLSSVISV